MVSLARSLLGHDEDIVRELWPAAKRAAQWQMARAETWQEGGQGLPMHVIDTYDGLSLNNYNASAFSGFFHLLAMKAAAALARSPVVDDPAFAANVTQAFEIGQKAMDRLLWNESHGFYRRFTLSLRYDFTLYHYCTTHFESDSTTHFVARKH